MFCINQWMAGFVCFFPLDIHRHFAAFQDPEWCPGMIILPLIKSELKSIIDVKMISRSEKKR